MTLRTAAAITVLARRAHDRLASSRLARADGQGTVEYVALILLVAGVLAAVVKVGGGWDGTELAKTIVGKLKDSIDGVGDAPGKG